MQSVLLNLSDIEKEFGKSSEELRDSVVSVPVDSGQIGRILFELENKKLLWKEADHILDPIIQLIRGADFEKNEMSVKKYSEIKESLGKNLSMRVLAAMEKKIEEMTASLELDFMNRTKTIPKISKTLRFFVGSYAYHGFFLSPRNVLHAFGSNQTYELGLGDPDNRLKPVFQTFFKKHAKYQVHKVAVANASTLYLTTNGLVFSSGGDEKGKTGQSKVHRTYTKTPAPIKKPRTREWPLNTRFLVADIFCGYYTNYLLTWAPYPRCVTACGGRAMYAANQYRNYGHPGMYHQVWAFGDNESGQLGVGHSTSMSIPTLCATFGEECFADISPGEDHCLFLTMRGKVYATGHNGFGRMGVDGCQIPTHVEFFKVPVSKLRTAEYHSLFLTCDNEVYVSGDSEFGQCGGGDIKGFPTPTRHPTLATDQNIVDLYTGATLSAFRRADGVILACGEGKFGQNGSETFESILTPLPMPRLKRTDFFTVASGAAHMYFLCDNFRAYGCGENEWGSLLNGQSKEQNLVQRIGHEFMDIMKKEYFEANDRTQRFLFVVKVMGGNVHVKNAFLTMIVEC